MKVVDVRGFSSSGQKWKRDPGGEVAEIP